MQRAFSILIFLWFAVAACPPELSDLLCTFIFHLKQNFFWNRLAEQNELPWQHAPKEVNQFQKNEPQFRSYLVMEMMFVTNTRQGYCRFFFVGLDVRTRVLPVPLLRSTKQYFSSYSFRTSWTSYKKKTETQTRLQSRDHQHLLEW